MIRLATRNLLRMLVIGLLGLLLAGHASVAAATACADMPGGQCAAVHAPVDLLNVDADDVAGAQDHASQCQDHCQTAVQPASFAALSVTGLFSMLAGPYPARSFPGRVIRPPR